MKRRINIIWFAACVSISWLSAQPVPNLDFEFSVMGAERMRDIGFAQLKPSARSNPRPTAVDFEIIPLRVSSQGRSDVYRFSGPPPLRFVATSDTGETLRATKMIGSINAGKLPARAMIFLDPREEGSVTAHWVDDSSAAFPAGHVRMVNLAQQRIEGALDGASFRMESAQILRAPQAVDNNVRLGVAYERMGRPVVVFDQSLRLSQNERVLLVFLPPFREGADVRVRVVRDQVRAPAVP
ncbi:MAG: hypothetical protein SynsKO_26130 [Synoicihabitans sp.]